MRTVQKVYGLLGVSNLFYSLSIEQVAKIELIPVNAYGGDTEIIVIIERVEGQKS